MRPIALLLDSECEALENFEALMALGNLASLNESVRARIIKDGNTIQSIENYMFEDHSMIRRAAVQCFTNLCTSPFQVKRCEGKNDKVSCYSFPIFGHPHAHGNGIRKYSDGG